MTATEALAGFEKAVGEYNLITIQNADLSHVTEAEGMIAVGGNLTINRDTFNAAFKADYANSTTSGAALYVKGQFRTNSTNKDAIKLDNGYASFGGVAGATAANWSTANRELTINGRAVFTEANSSSAKSYTNPLSASLSNNWDFSTLATQLGGVSDALTHLNASDAPKGTISVHDGKLSLSSSSIVAGQHGAIVFTLDMKKLGVDAYGHSTYSGVAFDQIGFDVADGYDYIVNVTHLNANSVLFKNVNFSKGKNYDQLLWNFVGSSSQSLSIATNNDFYGAVLAPTYNITSSALMDGQIVANSLNYTQDKELHYTGFDDEIPETPEASTYGLMGAALCLGLVVLRRRANK